MKKTNLAFAMAASALLIGFSAQAQEMYGGVGIDGATIGYAHGLSPSFTVRADVSGGSSYAVNQNTTGASYRVSYKPQSVNIYGDWFPGNSSFRLTGGLAFNDSKLQGNARGTQATIAGKPVNLTDAYLDVYAKYPSVAPYLGVGWGHRAATEKGWGFFADVGVLIGKFSVKSYDSNIPAKSGGTITTADMEAEMDKLQSKLNKLGVIPVVKVGVSYRF